VKPRLHSPPVVKWHIAPIGLRDEASFQHIPPLSSLCLLTLISNYSLSLFLFHIPYNSWRLISIYHIPIQLIIRHTWLSVTTTHQIYRKSREKGRKKERKGILNLLVKDLSAFAFAARHILYLFSGQIPSPLAKHFGGRRIAMRKSARGHHCHATSTVRRHLTSRRIPCLPVGICGYTACPERYLPFP